MDSDNIPEKITFTLFVPFFFCGPSPGEAAGLFIRALISAGVSIVDVEGWGSRAGALVVVRLSLACYRRERERVGKEKRWDKGRETYGRSHWGG